MQNSNFSYLKQAIVGRNTTSFSEIVRDEGSPKKQDFQLRAIEPIAELRIVMLYFQNLEY